MYYVRNKRITVLFFVRGSINYILWGIRDSQISVQPLPAIIPDNREYTLVLISSRFTSV
jgi:hypothetical protein